MNSRTYSSIAITLAAIGFAPLLPVRADGGVADQPAFVGAHYEGQISKVDGEAMTGTVTTRFAERALPFKATADTKIWKTRMTGEGKLKVGDKVMVVGLIVKGGDAIQASIVDVIPDLPVDSTGTGKSAKDGVYYGTLASVGDFTMTDRNGQILKLDGKAKRMLVGETVEASFDDLDPGATVKLDGKMDGATFIATRIVVQPTGRGGGKKGAKGKPKPVPVAAIPPATAPTTLTITSTSTGPGVAPTPPAKTYTDDDFSLSDLL